MPKVSGEVIKSGIKDGKFICLLQLNGRIPNPKEVIVCQWGKSRSLSQNAFLWVFYDWLLNEAGLKDEYATSEELHETLKVALLSKRVETKTGKIITKVGSTTNLDKAEFGDFMDKASALISEYHSIDTSEFWQQHEEMTA